MRDRLIELFREFQFKCHKQPCNRWNSQPIKVTPTHMKMEVPDCDECELGQIADYILADGWIRPPCKVGGKVYNTSGGEIRELIVRRINIEKDGFDIVLFPIGETTNGYWCREDRIGKNVFLTREEAEKVLEEVLEGGAEK